MTNPKESHQSLETDEDIDPKDPEYEPDEEDQKKLNSKRKTKLLDTSNAKSNRKTKSKSEQKPIKGRKSIERPTGEVASLLMQTEFSQAPRCIEPSNRDRLRAKIIEEDENDDDSEDEFEEVEDDGSSALAKDAVRSHKANVGKDGIDIRVGDSLVVRRVKKVSQVNAELDITRMALNRQMKQVQANLHRVHIMFMLSRQHYLFDLAADPLLQALLISLGLDQSTVISGPLSVDSIRSLLVHYTKRFKVQRCKKARPFTFEAISDFLQSKDTAVGDVYTFTFFAIVYLQLERALKLHHLRLCYAIEPVSKRPDRVFVFRKEVSDRVSRTIITKALNNDRPFKRHSKEPDLHSVRFWFELLIDLPSPRWVSVEPLNQWIDENAQIETCFMHPIPYVLALDADRELFDVTQNYCEHYFEPRYRKQRDEPFLNELLLLNGGHVDSNSDGGEQVEKVSDDRVVGEAAVPLPKTLTSFKNHPVYVLPRHLLKYEVLHPPNAPVYGEFRGEQVYARRNVHIAHSKEYWKREARIVRSDEEPYKMTTARPKWDKNANDYIRGLPLELYGEWQTEPYDPPQAIDGKVPRNEFHNVDLFKPQMLPKGCVHLRLNGLLRIASKLNIDCAAAVTGFDVSKRGTIPVTDGFVVCSEFEQLLTDAWREEQVNAKRRERERYLARVFKNWKKLINLARARIRIRLRYHDMIDD
jgi:hypothetical protein